MDTRVALSNSLSIVRREAVPRHTPSRGEVLIASKRRPIIGRICMDATLIQLEPSDDVSIGDEAVLIGRQGDAEIGIDEVAAPRKHDFISHSHTDKQTRRTKLQTVVIVRGAVRNRAYRNWNKCAWKPRLPKLESARLETAPTEIEISALGNRAYRWEIRKKW